MSPAAWLWIRRDARRRLRSLALFALLVALAGGVVMAAVAGGRRGGTALERSDKLTNPADVLALPNEPGFDWQPVRDLPEVASLAEFPVSLFVADIDPEGMTLGFPPGSPEGATEVERPIVVSGRQADQSRVDEVTISPEVRSSTGRDVGDHIELRMFAAETVESLWAGTGGLPETADGPTQDAVVVGVVKNSWFGGGINTTLAFFEQYRAELAPPSGYINALARLRNGEADLPAFRAGLERIAGHPVEMQTASVEAKRITHATDLERVALFAFALAAGAASLVLLGQAALRMVAAPAGELPLLRALGFTRSEQLLAMALAPAAASIAGALGALPVAFALSPRLPIGIGRRIEPDVGFHVDWTVFGFGLLAMAAVALAGCTVLGLRQLRRATASATRPRGSTIARWVAGAAAPIPVWLGTRLALERGTGRSAVPVRPALIGAVVGVLGIVGATTFREGLDRAATDRSLYGQRFDAWFEPFAFDESTFPVALDALGADPDVEMVEELRVGVVLIDGLNITVFGARDIKGDYGLEPLAGRPPESDAELSLAPTDMKALGVHVGDEVLVGDEQRPMRVVGETFTPEYAHTPYDQGARMTDAGLRRFLPDESQLKFHMVALRFRDGVDVDATVGRLNDGAAQNSITPAGEPNQDQQNLRGVRNVPLALGAFLALLAVAALGHALATAVRRRRHDVAVLRVLGLTRRQARASVAWQATTLALIGLAIGLPLGIAIGRAAWRAVADSTPVLYAPPFAALVVALVGPAAILIANGVAAWPARVAARTRPAEVLRVE